MTSTFDNLFIFEMANNHQGNVQHGIQIIREVAKVCREYKIKGAIKFQYRNLDTLLHPAFIGRPDVKHFSRFLSTRLNGDQFYEMVCATREEGMITMCTPFDEDSVEMCVDHGIDIIKIASCSATDWPLLETVAATKKPVILSTGGKSFSDMDKIYNFFTHRDTNFAMLHCVGIYPVKNEMVQLSCIDKMKKRYINVPIGYSGHEDPTNFIVPQMAVAKGATIFERHVGLATNEIKLNAYSMDARDAGQWVEAILTAQTICGVTGEKAITNEEIESMNELARGCYAKHEIRKGDVINREDIFFAMPCTDKQTTSGIFTAGCIASRDYAAQDAVFERRPVSLISDTRSIIHDVKGMLFEARIAISDDFELELSHHYGMEHFRSYGATIINIINRQYCKKIIAILPGQKHPNHYHKIKEESFQVLSGVLTLTLNGKTQDIHAGQVVTVERGMWHAFTSAEGCIFEEISTTHVKNDSYYEDDRIAKQDLMERKTILEDW